MMQNKRYICINWTLNCIASYLYEAKQSVDIIHPFDPKQSVSQDIILPFDAKQSVSQDIIHPFDAKQSVSQDIIHPFDTKQYLTQALIHRLDAKKYLHRASPFTTLCFASYPHDSRQNIVKRFAHPKQNEILGSK
ncbi:hypothetical protein CEXT_593281 [Caerostris extrusa]|uniref:Uncharacterized protein n=1 Tax=Caerostris extrusa TaxID=172846 RepID=A0AAV4T0B8_CAEEX|nr:hypothetical protein CEXT_593281 [Caerostris extrusa]